MLYFQSSFLLTENFDIETDLKFTEILIIPYSKTFNYALSFDKNYLNLAVRTALQS